MKYSEWERVMLSEDGEFVHFSYEDKKEMWERRNEKVLVIEKWEKEKNGSISHKIMGEVTPCKNVTPATTE